MTRKNRNLRQLLEIIWTNLSDTQRQLMAETVGDLSDGITELGDDVQKMAKLVTHYRDMYADMQHQRDMALDELARVIRDRDQRARIVGYIALNYDLSRQDAEMLIDHMTAETHAPAVDRTIEMDFRDALHWLLDMLRDEGIIDMSEADGAAD